MSRCRVLDLFCESFYTKLQFSMYVDAGNKFRILLGIMLVCSIRALRSEEVILMTTKQIDECRLLRISALAASCGHRDVVVLYSIEPSAEIKERLKQHGNLELAPQSNISVPSCLVPFSPNIGVSGLSQPAALLWLNRSEYKFMWLIEDDV